MVKIGSHANSFGECGFKFIPLSHCTEDKKGIMGISGSYLKKIYKSLFEPKLTTTAGKQDLKCKSTRI